MALQVGELNAILTVDDRTVNPALRRAENALRDAGQTMSDDADHAGQQAGEGLGDGIVRGVDGRLRNAQGRFVAAGRRAGDAVGSGLADGAADGADEAVEQTGGAFERLKTMAAGAGLAAGAVLAAGLQEALDQNRITAVATAGLADTPAQAQLYGKAAGQLYKNAVVTNFEEGMGAIASIAKSGLVPPDATIAQLTTIGTKVSDLSTKYHEETGAIVRAAQKLLATGLAKTSEEAFDLIAKGFDTSANQGEDFLDTLNEYSVQFKRVGLDGKTSIGLITQAISKGARDSDQVADAIGQFGELALEGGTAVDEAFKSIGLNADEVRAKLAKGGKSGQEALQMTTDALRGTTDASVRLAAAGALFGDPGKVMGDALFALNPASAAASSGMDKARGSMDKLGKGLRQGPAYELTRFKNSLRQNLIEFLGNSVIPAMAKAFGFVREHSTAFKVAGLVITSVLVPALILMGVTATVAASRVMWGWITSGAAAVKGAAIQVASAARTAGAWVMMKARAIGSFIAMAASATANALKTAAVWAASAARMSATWLVGILRVAAVTTAQFLLMAAKAVAWAAVMAAQWFIALGPVGWVTAVIIGLVALVIAKWDTIKAYTQAAWNWVVAQVRGAIHGVLSAVAWLGRLPGQVLGYFSRLKDSAVRKAAELVAWMRSWPGSISRSVGSLGGLLVTKGVQVVQGLWSGIKSMGGWIRSQLISWAKNMIPGPIAKALGIASPSKVTKAQGRWIARGLVDGLTGSSKQVRTAATKLADIVRDSLAPGKKRSKALKRISGDTKKLLGLASQEEKVAARLKSAQKRLADQIKARDKLAADVKKGVLDSANITSQDTGGWPQTAESILAGLKQDRAAAEAFAKNLATLRKKGVRADLIAQIAQAGVEQGSSAAAALANANASQIKQINAEQKALVGAAGNAGTVAGNAMYGAGIQAAKGMVKGLQSQQKQIEKQMLQIAKGMSKAIRKALGIKSPSKVMAQVGAYTAEGLRQGIEGGRRAVNRSMASLVDTQVPGSFDSASARARAAASQRVVLELRSSGRGEDDYLMERVRRGIRRKAGGDVDFALAGRRAR